MFIGVDEDGNGVNFTPEQAQLLTQYSDETGDRFPDDVMDFIADKTGGQPYLIWPSKFWSRRLNPTPTPDPSSLPTPKRLT